MVERQPSWADIVRAKGKAGEEDGPKTLFARDEYVRILTQSLMHLGYRRSAKLLVEESGVEMESPLVQSFRNAFEEGNFPEVERIMRSMAFSTSKADAEKEARFLLYEQMCLEALEKSDKKGALKIIRTHLAPLGLHSERVHVLSTCVMTCEDASDIAKRTGWKGSSPDARRIVIDKIQSYVSPTLMIPDGRLDTLLTQAIEHQKQQCLFHNTSCEQFSLLEDHRCTKDRIPRFTQAVLTGHDDEVWVVKFSHDGTRLATGSKDATVIIWSSDTYEPLHVLRGHTDAVSCLAWSPNDDLLLTGGGDRDCSALLWSTFSGSLISSIKPHKHGITGCAWTPDGTRFVTGSTDQTIQEFRMDGSLVYTWQGVRAIDVAICHAPRASATAPPSSTAATPASTSASTASPSTGASSSSVSSLVTNGGPRSAKGKAEAHQHYTLVVICYERKVRLYDMTTHELTHVIQETSSITSLTLSLDGNFALLNVCCEELHLWDLKRQQLVHKYTGHKQERFAIRSCFGGTREAFIASGSEDGNVYLYHRESEKVLEVMKGHHASVNAVSWHPSNPAMLASASDDNTVRIWGPTQPVIDGFQPSPSSPINGSARKTVTSV